jgi:hypothetical protein
MPCTLRFTDQSTNASHSALASESLAAHSGIRIGAVRLPLPFTTRMTVVQLTSGDLFLHSPIALDNENVGTWGMSVPLTPRSLAFGVAAQFELTLR